MRHIKLSLAMLAAGSALSIAGGLPAFAASGGSPASGWHIGYYQNTAPSPSNAAAPSPDSGTASLNFTSEPNTSLLVTGQKAQFGSLLGDLTGKTVTANFTITGVSGAFTYYGEGTSSNPCATPANTRLYFETSNAGGFAYTHYWWSNPVSATLDNGTFTISANVDPSEWSDWNGQLGSTDPDAFNAAAGNVTEIGLSFGGGCFFENGVGTTDGSGTLTLNSFTAS